MVEHLFYKVRELITPVACAGQGTMQTPLAAYVRMYLNVLHSRPSGHNYPPQCNQYNERQRHRISKLSKHRKIL